MTARIEETVLGWPPPAIEGRMVKKQSVMTRMHTEHGDAIVSIASVETYRLFKRPKKRVQVIRLTTTELKK